MRAALHVHGLEVALRTDSRELESLVLHRYWGHLGAVRQPVIVVVLHPARDGEIAVGSVDVRGVNPVVDAVLPASSAALDDVVLAVAAPLLVRAGSLLVRCGALFDADGGHVMLGDARRGVDGETAGEPSQRLVLHQRGARWRVATTPFGAVGSGWPDRRAPLRAIYVLDEAPAAALRGAVGLEDASPVCEEAARVLATTCAAAVPSHDVVRDAGRRRLAALLERADAPVS